MTPAAILSPSRAEHQPLVGARARGMSSTIPPMSMFRATFHRCAPALLESADGSSPIFFALQQNMVKSVSTKDSAPRRLSARP
jgi:hypothetical protein